MAKSLYTSYSAPEDELAVKISPVVLSPCVCKVAVSTWKRHLLSSSAEVLGSDQSGLACFLSFNPISSKLADNLQGQLHLHHRPNLRATAHSHPSRCVLSLSPQVLPCGAGQDMLFPLLASHPPPPFSNDDHKPRAKLDVYRASTAHSELISPLRRPRFRTSATT
jgi:hypothetical protein